MCGIAGFSGNFSIDLLIHANNLMVHRGPDAEGIWWNYSMGIGLAHRRLSILDLSTSGAQPMMSDNDEVVLVFNGEIYNYRELKAELKSSGRTFHGDSDTEVLLQLFLEYGEEMLPRLNGIFAFAIWDKRSQSLFVARDALGVKPLYFSESNEGFAFASEIKALMCIVPGMRTLDIPALHRYLSFLWCPGEGTPLRDVRKMMPGEAICVRKGKIVHRWIWYQLPAFRGLVQDYSESKAIAQTTESLRQAVKRQLVADVPVGAFLSGGLDSSAVVTFAREQISDLRCFTVETEGGQEPGTVDDLPYAKQVADHLGVSLDIVTIEAGRMAADFASMIEQLGEPLADPAPLNLLYISQFARKLGIKVLLSGAGGDDLFTGYRRHVAVKYEKYWSWLPEKVRVGLQWGTGCLNQRRALFRRLTKLLNGVALEGDARLANYFLWSNEAILYGLYTKEFRAQLGKDVASTPMLEFLKPLPDSVPPLERMLTLEQRFFLADHNLAYTDKMSMAAGVEVRVPFLDLELIEHAARIPVGIKHRGRVSKQVLKKAMEPYLPRSIIYRPKSGFGAPLRRWIKCELRPLLTDLLSEESLKRRGLFEPKAIQRLIAQNDSGQVDAAYLLLSLMSIEIWMRTYIDAVSMNRKRIAV